VFVMLISVNVRVFCPEATPGNTNMFVKSPLFVKSPFGKPKVTCKLVDLSSQKLAALAEVRVAIS
jgi:hypothetical protein